MGSLCSTSTLVVRSASTQTVPGCDISRIFQRCGAGRQTGRPGTSLHNAVLILNNVASQAFSSDQLSGAATLTYSGSLRWLFSIIFSNHSTPGNTKGQTGYFLFFCC